MLSANLEVKTESSPSSIAEVPEHMHFTAAACGATQVDVVQPNTTDHVDQAQPVAQPINVADSDFSPGKRLPSDEKDGHFLRQKTEEFAYLYMWEKSKAEKAGTIAIPLALNVQRIIHEMVVKTGITDAAVPEFVAGTAAKAVLLAACAVFMSADTDFSQEDQSSLAATNIMDRLCKQYVSLIAFVCSKAADVHFPDDATALFDRAMEIYDTTYDELCEMKVSPFHAGSYAGRAATVVAIVFRSVYVAKFGTIPATILFADAAFSAVSNAVCIRYEFCYGILSEGLHEQSAVAAARAVALSAYEDCLTSYGKIYSKFIAVGVSPVEAVESALDTCKVVAERSKEQCTRFVNDYANASGPFSTQSVVNEALHNFKAGFSLKLEAYSNVFAFAFNTKAAFADANCAPLFFLNTGHEFLYAFLRAVVKAGASPADIVDASKDVLDAPVKFYQSIISVILAKTNVGLKGACEVALVLLVDIVRRINWDVSSGLIKATTTPMEAVNAIKGVFDIFSRFFHDVFTTAFTKTNVELDAVDIAHSALKDLANIYPDILTAAATSATKAALAFTGKFYHRVFITAIKNEATPEGAANIARLALGHVHEIRNCFTAVEACLVPLVTAKTVDAAVQVPATPPLATITADVVPEVPTAPLPVINIAGGVAEAPAIQPPIANTVDVVEVPASLLAAKIVDAAMNAFGAIYTKSFLAPYAKIRAHETMSAGVTSLDVDGKDPSLKQNADVALLDLDDKDLSLKQNADVASLDVDDKDPSLKQSADVTSLDADNKDPSLQQNVTTICKITFNDVHVAAMFAGLNASAAFVAAEKAATAVRDVYYSEFKDFHARSDFASMDVKKATDLALDVAFAVCVAYRNTLVSVLKANPSIVLEPTEEELDAATKWLDAL